MLQVPPKSSSSTKNAKFHVCHRCKRFCLVNDYQFDSSFSHLSVCYNCELLENWRSDGSMYDHMLKDMRVREDLYNDGARLAHLIQVRTSWWPTYSYDHCSTYIDVAVPSLFHMLSDASQTCLVCVTCSAVTGTEPKPRFLPENRNRNFAVFNGFFRFQLHDIFITYEVTNCSFLL